MNTRDEWAALSEAFPEAAAVITPEQLAALQRLSDWEQQNRADEYQAEAIATAQSEAAQEAAQQEFRRG